MTTAAPRPTSPVTDLRLARLHLRMGQLGLARAELESLAGSGDLDDAGLLALAEARWRTGDLTGAGEAAQAYLAIPDADAIIGLVIAAESVAAAGRPGEARRIAGRALEQKELPLDRIFAGMPRSSIWPADPADGSQPAGTLFEGHPPARSAAPSAEPAVAPRPADDHRPGLWDAEAGEPELPPPAALLEEARGALEVGRLPEAALFLGIVLRVAPELAPAVLEATDARARRTPEIELVRGDAFRLVGHELDARRAWIAAATGSPSPDVPPATESHAERPQEEP